MDYSVVPLFSKVFYYNILEDISKEKLKEIKEYAENQEFKNSGTGSAYESEESGDDFLAESSTRFDILEDEQLGFLKDRILKEFYVFKNHILRVEDLDFGITTSWLARSKPNKTSHLHSHFNCFYSGIFYIDVVPNSGDIYFEHLIYRTFNYDEKVCESNIYNSKAYRWTPENRTILFFPSEVHHKLLVNRSDIDRYSLAFNIVPLGNIGVFDSQFSYRKNGKESR
tara:strand:- start:1051 stop:1728 length:678 start_codon:yes stop_codon:yes gene_type:complete